MPSRFKNLLVIFPVLVTGACQSIPEPEPLTLSEPVVEVDSEQVKVIDTDRQNYDAGLVALKAGKYQLAVELLEQVSAGTSELEFVFTNTGIAHFNQKNYDKAELAFQQAIESKPDDAIAYNYLGIIKRLHGKFDSARKTYLKAIQIDNNYANAYLNLGILYDIYLQDLKQALQQYEKYQAITGGENKSVAKWIDDIRRQLKTANNSAQG